MVRVLGVGIGLFIVAFIWILCLFLCLLISRASTNISKLGPLLLIAAAVITIILVFIPREPQFPTADQQAVVYDYTVVYRSALIAVMALSILVGGGLFW
ncbi:transmembrane protein 218-like [Pomacea canaliculata]|uniref:transmembrane protein 218-like n=1 Tax=Pomacea canaliculata TaxID=400727 RepID=UPI000D72B4A8|nr:transmembrane protein 218-like [Pomacea canaliculata]